MSYKPKNELPVVEYLKAQGRFAHMFKPGNEWFGHIAPQGPIAALAGLLLLQLDLAHAFGDTMVDARGVTNDDEQ